MFSNRHNSENYRSPDGKWVLKLEMEGFSTSKESLLQEQLLCKNIYSLGISTPQVGELVEVDGRMGLVYECIPNKMSVSRCVGRDPQNIELYMKIFAENCKVLHGMNCDTKRFQCIESRYKEYLNSSSLFNDDVKARIYEIMDRTPKLKACLHGDLQTGNLLLNENGAYFIDIGSFAYGNPLYDLGCYYNFTHYAPNEFLLAAHYMDATLMRKCWDFFAKYYFDADSPEKLKVVDKLIKPYALTTMVFFDHVKPSGRAHETLVLLLERVLKDLEC